MGKKLILIILGFGFICLNAQEELNEIKSMRWGMDYNIYLEMSNDSNYVLDINDLFHSGTVEKNYKEKKYTYYPVVLGESFLKQLQERNIEFDTLGYDTKVPSANKTHRTLWSALHHSIGGGWIHFQNCLLYSLETRQLLLTAPLLTRPDTKWRPRPATESYKRTKKWDYYVPVNQKHAIKEYELRKKENELGDLVHIPEDYIQLFLNTGKRDYQDMIEQREYNKVAKIDLVKLILGAKYLGIPQINYIRSMVLNAMLRYTASQQLPSIIIFDDLEAAAAMTLNENGYAVEKIVFKNQGQLTGPEKKEKEKTLKNIIAGINEVNKRLFEQKLEKYYK